MDNSILTFMIENNVGILLKKFMSKFIDGISVIYFIKSNLQHESTVQLSSLSLKTLVDAHIPPPKVGHESF